MSTATCIDCGLDVVYNDEGFWPWRGIDGTDTCTAPGKEQRISNCHRIYMDDARDIFAEFQKKTGKTARHS